VKILAIDTTGGTVTAALAGEDAVIGEVFINSAQNHSITLMPMIKYLLDSAGAEVSDLTHIACASGPGSFTGLRIGAATAKAMAYAADIPIVAVPTLDALAYNIFDAQSVIGPIMDARRRQVYTAYYERDAENDDLIRLSDYRAMDIADVLRELSGFSKPVVFLGDGAPVYKDVILNCGLGNKRVFAPLPALLQRASSVARLAVKLALEGKTTESAGFTPFYLRQSQAERERGRK
jgi:tRNA threonylcarbamoyladenosine biosynthesis protein TsaB